MVSVLAALALAAPSASVQTEFNRIADEMTRLYMAKDFRGLGDLFAPNCRFVYSGNRSMSAEERLATLTTYYGQAGHFSVKFDIRLLKSTQASANTFDRNIYTVTDSRGRQAKTYRLQSNSLWIRSGAGWLLQTCKLLPQEERGADGKWGPIRHDLIPVVTVKDGGGTGPAPLAAMKRVLTELVAANNRFDDITISRFLGPAYYQIGVNGKRYTKADLLRVMRLYAPYKASTHYETNYFIQAWTPTTATLTASSAMSRWVMDHGRRVWKPERQLSQSWWVLTPAGWQIEHTKVWSTSYEDAEGKWHTQSAKR